MKTQIILPLFVIGLAMTSCKKEYTCNCITTDTTGGGPALAVSNKSTAYSAKMTKKQAEAACKHEETAVQSNFESFGEAITVFSGDPVDMSGISTSCSLK
jgi:hypothetical protein